MENNPQQTRQALEKFVFGLAFIEILAGGLAVLVCLLAASGEGANQQLAWMLFGPVVIFLPLGVGLVRRRQWVLTPHRFLVPAVLVAVPTVFAFATDFASMSPAILVGAIMAFAVAMLFHRPEMSGILHT